jgi:Tfp pilus assembly pilus retraction ATPase PilT
MIRKDLNHLIQGAMETGAGDGMYTMDKSIEYLTNK